VAQVTRYKMTMSTVWKNCRSTRFWNYYYLPKKILKFSSTWFLRSLSRVHLKL